MYYPALTTAALFTAIIIEDAISRKSINIANHIFLGIVSVWLMIYLCFNGAGFVAWGLLILPMFIIFLSYILTQSKSDTDSPKPTTVTPKPMTDTSKPITTPGYSISKSPNTTSLAPVGASPIKILPGQTIQIPMTSTTVPFSVSNITPNTSKCTS